MNSPTFTLIAKDIMTTDVVTLSVNETVIDHRQHTAERESLQRRGGAKSADIPDLKAILIPEYLAG